MEVKLSSYMLLIPIALIDKADSVDLTTSLFIGY